MKTTYLPLIFAVVSTVSQVIVMCNKSRNHRKLNKKLEDPRILDEYDEFFEEEQD